MEKSMDMDHLENGYTVILVGNDGQPVVCVVRMEQIPSVLHHPYLPSQVRACLMLLKDISANPVTFQKQ